MSIDHDASQQLEKLFDRTVSASEAYNNASKNVHNKPLTVFFEKAARTHESFSEKLKPAIEKVGGHVDDSSSLKSEANLFWLDFASIIVRRNEAAILKACAKSEEKALQQYDSVLQSDIPDTIKTEVVQQRDYAADLLEEVKSLEKQYASD